ncbi:3-phosphoshikimate 1-carboxyvinyltransferase [Arboricoccus pini]|uniref:3-phosphoshikimate 1-carboxyvinyltransferase n=1 Tax=Arboricoccus pini TaxID=1963835 RepID=A0A212R688_9PROT|nr:3-phosphoshikimate 1-carboxyvinyltransferase [Arboricoccus pini]SNB67628.1 3-phosphoshikimate 1-carboxyvinyltransferase [Arboricoccus pini]
MDQSFALADLDTRALLLVPPARPLRGRVVLPGSKSITNRALLLAGLAKGRSHLKGALKSDDTARMAEALVAMGVRIEEPDATSFVVAGTGRLLPPPAPLFLGNAGTATRFLTAAASLVEGEVVVDGDPHMRKRPIAPLIEALARLGIEASAPTGCPPVTIKGKGGFSGRRVEIDAGLSSQYVSALLMLAAFGEAPVEIVLKGQAIGARGYVDLTQAAMAAFGAEVTPLGPGAWRVAPTRYHAADLMIEPDASAATYLWAAAALTGGDVDLGLPPETFTQPDARAYALIRAFPRLPSVIEGSQMQDAVPTLAALAAFNEGPVRFTGIANLRVKECDRVHAMASELQRVRPGLAREEGDDLIVMGDPALAGSRHPARIETYADHRIAMSMALVGLLVGGIAILDPTCVGKTYPGFWQALADLGVALEKLD